MVPARIRSPRDLPVVLSSDGVAVSCHHRGHVDGCAGQAQGKVQDMVQEEVPTKGALVICQHLQNGLYQYDILIIR